MDYESLSTFTEEFKKVYRDYKDGDATKAHEIYCSAYNNPLQFCLIGRLTDRNTIIGRHEKEDPDRKKLLGSDDAANFEVSNLTQPGQVLKVADEDWSAPFNDAWVLGSIHARKTFNIFCSVEFTQDTLDDFIAAMIAGAGRRPLTVTGRELLGLFCCQNIYEPRSGYGCLAVVPVREDAGDFDLSFSAYHAAIQNLEAKGPDTAVATIRNWLKRAF